MGNLELYDVFRAVPDEAKKPIAAGRLKGKTDINPMWRIKVLTEQFGACGFGWYYTVTNKWLEKHGDETAAFVDIELYIKRGEEWSKPIHGTGGSMFAEKEKNGVYVSDECYKMATTDAISVACKQLGIGADVYWSNDRSKYDTREVELDPAKTKVENVHINTIFTELARTGVGMKGILKCYELSDIHDMTIAQFKDAMEKLSKKPNKKPEPVPDPPMDSDGDLPWNTVEW